MNANLLSLAQGAPGGDFSKLAGQFLGESQGATQSALTSLLPVVLGSIVQKGATPQGASGLMSLINGANLDVSSLGNLAGLFGGGGSGMNALLKAGTISLPVSAPAPMPAPAAPVTPVGMTLPAKVYFDVGAADIGADSSSKIAAVADMAKKDGLRPSVTGYTDKTRDVAKNEELAKSRAMAVRDALKAAGVVEANIETKPPMFVEVGASGGDAEARRVEISKQ